jgi:hypothetical protein
MLIAFAYMQSAWFSLVKMAVRTLMSTAQILTHSNRSRKSPQWWPLALTSKASELHARDATTNLSLVYAATQKENYCQFLDEVLTDRRKSGPTGLITGSRFLRARQSTSTSLQRALGRLAYHSDRCNECESAASGQSSTAVVERAAYIIVTLP